MPAVNSLSLDAFKKLGAAARYSFCYCHGEELLGFVFCFVDGAAYESENFLWFCKRHDSFAYIDRVIVGPEARGKGVGAALYRAVIDAIGKSKGVLTCEVNTDPPNPASIRFHEGLGFEAVGSATTSGGAKTVRYFEKELTNPDPL